MTRLRRALPPEPATTAPPATGRLTLRPTRDPDHGNTITLHATLTQPDSTPITDAVITGRARTGDHHHNLGVATHHSNGHYTLPFTPDQPGRWHIHLETPSAEAPATTVLYARRSRFP